MPLGSQNLPARSDLNSVNCLIKVYDFSPWIGVQPYSAILFSPNWLLFPFSTVPIFFFFFTPLKPFIFFQPLNAHVDVLSHRSLRRSRPAALWIPSAPPGPICLMACIFSNGPPSSLPAHLFRIIFWIHIIVYVFQSFPLINPAGFQWLIFSYIWCISLFQFGLTQDDLPLFFHLLFFFSFFHGMDLNLWN